MTKLIVGLGNPGQEYEHTRHNVGFLTIDALATLLGASYWKVQNGALVSVIEKDGARLILAKPQSFMNTSGGPTKLLCAEFAIDYLRHPEDIIVIHDELDIPSGEVRVKHGGGHAGHNGLRSIHEKLGTDAYTRVRIGIGRPPGRMSASDFVLQEPRGEEAQSLAVAIAEARDMALELARSGSGA